MQFNIVDEVTLPGDITLDAKWMFSFDTDELAKVKVRYVDKKGNRIKREVDIEAVPAEIRKQGIMRMRDMQGELQMPGEEL